MPPEEVLTWECDGVVWTGDKKNIYPSIFFPRPISIDFWRTFYHDFWWLFACFLRLFTVSWWLLTVLTIFNNFVTIHDEFSIKSYVQMEEYAHFYRFCCEKTTHKVRTYPSELYREYPPPAGAKSFTHSISQCTFITFLTSTNYFWKHVSIPLLVATLFPTTPK